MRNEESFYVTPSRTQRGSWNVLDRDGCAPEGGHAVEIAHVTCDEAKRCASSLNMGKDAYAWLD